MNKDLTILVTGGSGQIGSEIRHSLNTENISFLFPSSKELDIRKESSIKSFFNNNNFDLIINCAAYTDVDNAENNKKSAEQVNYLGAKFIAKESFLRDIGLIHISTDYVFGANSNGPFFPASKRDPSNFYGITKSLGEEAVLGANNKSVVIRMASIYSKFGNNFIKTICSKILESNEIKVVSDQLISLSSANSFSKNINEILNLYYKLIKKDNFDSRIIHFTDKEYTSWFSVANVINDEINNIVKPETECNIIPITTDNWKSIAKRPLDSRLEVDFSFFEKNNIFLENWENNVRSLVKLILKNQ